MTVPSVVEPKLCGAEPTHGGSSIILLYAHKRLDQMIYISFSFSESSMPFVGIVRGDMKARARLVSVDDQGLGLHVL